LADQLTGQPTLEFEQGPLALRRTTGEPRPVASISDHRCMLLNNLTLVLCCNSGLVLLVTQEAQGLELQKLLSSSGPATGRSYMTLGPYLRSGRFLPLPDMPRLTS
jgi:hypothetical protein